MNVWVTSNLVIYTRLRPEKFQNKTRNFREKVGDFVYLPAN